MRWRLGVLLREGLENVAANPIRAAILFIAAAGLIGSVAYIELADVHDLKDYARNYEAAGGYVVVVHGEAPFPASVCAGLAHHPEVRASGAVLGTGGQASFGSAPGSLFRRITVTEGILAVWSGSRAAFPPTEGSFVVGTAAASELGLRPGLFLVTEDGPVPIAAVLDTDRRYPEGVRSVIDVAAPSGGTQQCWVEFTPGAYEGGLNAVAAALATSGEPPTVRRYLRAGEFALDPVAELDSRIQARGWAVVALLIAALFWLDAWFRRAEIGLYLALSGSRSVVFVLGAVEAWFVIAAGFLAGLLWAVVGQGVASDLSWDAFRIAAQTATQIALLAGLLAPIGGLIVARADIASLLKDR